MWASVAHTVPISWHWGVKLCRLTSCASPIKQTKYVERTIDAGVRRCVNAFGLYSCRVLPCFSPTPAFVAASKLYYSPCIHVYISLLFNLFASCVLFNFIPCDLFSCWFRMWQSQVLISRLLLPGCLVACDRTMLSEPRLLKLLLRA
jgi:hypothetical protein